MRIFFVLIIFYAGLSSLNLPQELAGLSSDLQKKCSELFLFRLEHGELASAFVCGTRIQDPHSHFLFAQTSLIHLMVVSGGHLQMLSAIFELFVPAIAAQNLFFSLLHLILLGAYTLVTGFQAPLVRALTASLLRRLAAKMAWSWSAAKVQLASGLLLLALAPEWVLNFSFYLSWLSSLGLLVFPLCLSRTSVSLKGRVFLVFLNSLSVQTLISVALGSFSFLGVILNTLLAPLIAGLLFPISISALALPWPEIIDLGWDSLIKILELILSLWPWPPAIANLGEISWPSLWLFLAFLHGFLHFLTMQRYRDSYA